MNVATSSEAGIRELKNSLSRYLDLVREGEVVTVTDRGRPIARIVPVDAASDRLADLVRAGVVRPPSEKRRRRPERRVVAHGPVSDLVKDQRR